MRINDAWSYARKKGESISFDRDFKEAKIDSRQYQTKKIAQLLNSL